MSNVLMCATPVYGHVAPMITIGGHLVDSGHRVRMLTGSRFAAAVTAAGMEHIALPPACDFDDRSPETFAGGEGLTGVRKLRFDVEHHFISVMPHQYRGLRDAMRAEPTDVVLTETAFTGAFALTREPKSQRPPVLVCGVLPLTVSSRDTAPFGIGLPPATSPVGRARNRLLNLMVSKVVFAGAQKAAQGHLRDLGLEPLPCFVLDGPSLADGLLQLTSAGFEYPRSDLRTSISFVGAVLPPSGPFQPPHWWPELDEGRPVVHVTQGTIANKELQKLVRPTIEALADRNVLVVATTGDEATASDLRAVAPANVRVEAFIPYDWLLPKVNAMVTNGGYGGVQFALGHGVPLVVAGDTEEKPEIAARVAWTGAGINLRTGSPQPADVGDAVDRVLTEPSFRLAAQRLQAELAQCTPLESIERAVREASTLNGAPSA
ncbi:MAG: glycosyl transferase [Acidimicrobiia bacterium]|nr:glycosyl transferase [Acidimicrobiia bacterium]